MTVSVTKSLVRVLTGDNDLALADLHEAIRLRPELADRGDVAAAHTLASRLRGGSPGS